MPGFDTARTYAFSYDRAALVGFEESRGSGVPAVRFFPLGVPGLRYDRTGALTGIAYANGVSVTIDRDIRSRPSSYAATVGGGADGWSSGAYAYDGAGNIAAIGGQAYAYDAYGRLTAARILPQARDKNETSPWEVAYTYDLYGNLTGRHHMGTSKAADRPTVFEFDHTVTASPTEVTRNRIEESYFAYDADGNMTRLSEDNGALMSMYWDDRGRMTAVGMNQPEVAPTAHTIAERYVYDAAGYRLLRIPESTTVGETAIGIQLRDGAGQLLSEYEVGSANGSPNLVRDYVHGAGQLLVERTVVTTHPTVTTSTNFAQGGSYGFSVEDPEPAASYVADVRTEGGYQTTVSGIVPDGSGNFSLPESTFALDTANYVRVRREGDGQAYSAPLTLAIDSTITASSPNPIRTMSISRSGNSVILRWEQLAVSGLPTTLRFDRGDGTPLTAISMPLPSGATTWTLATQALSSGCGTISGTQPVGQGGSSVPTIGGPVPDPTPNQNLSTGYSGSCTEDPPPPSWNGYRFANTYHARDHLGTLRLETGGGGEVTGRHDFYPFGTEVPEPGGEVDTDGSRKRYTGHERDAGTNLDYMLARYYGGAMGRFASVDPVNDTDQEVPLSQNRFMYVRENPIRSTDPTGQWVLIDDAAFMVGGAVVGVAGQLISDAMSGQTSGWEDYAGAAVGGAIGGEALLYTGPIGAGAAGGAATNLTKQALKNLTGKQEGFDGVSLVADTTLGAATGLVPGVRIPGVTAGRGNFNQVFKQMTTKAANGTISNVTPKTAAKMLTGRSIDTGLVPGAGAAAVAGGSGYMPSSEERRPPAPPTKGIVRESVEVVSCH